MFKFRVSSGVAACLVLVLNGCSSSPAEAPLPALTAEGVQPAQPAEQSALEAQVIPNEWVKGEAGPPAPLAERMAVYNVPAVTVAVYRGGSLHWAEAYGTGADADTLFQAASMSKMVAATGIAALAKEKGVSLDADISASLTGLDMSAVNPDGLPITLRGLLSHTNGANVHGFPGYAAGVPVPTTLQVITGSEITNTDAVVIRRPDPAAPFSYSGGGYTIAQLWAEQVSGEDFAALMQRLVLEPVGMTRSTFSAPDPGEIIAPAHDRTGQEIPGRWHTYPEMAAASLWTTPTEFGQFLIALGRAAAGEAGAGIDPAVAAEVIRPVTEDYGLGVGILYPQGEMTLQHSGGNEGYECYGLTLPGRGDAIVVMTNAQGGTRLYREIVRTAEGIYNWPSAPRETKPRFAMAEADLAALAGTYAFEGQSEAFLEVRAEAGDLAVSSPVIGDFRMVPVAEDLFIALHDGQEVRVERAAGGVRLMTGGILLVKLP